ncbi:MAG: hypothetical protein A2Z15_01185 [Chloroflexi bacterium RBG_16_50_11]|nr:MAG: hypothetical protein A2Z15_01185 [Chloroflexi bacterium RBG_16_50_11]
MEEKAKRKKGGQKGNRNAAKPSFYLKIFDEAERFDFADAAGIEGIDEEIALLRLEIKKAISGGDARNLLLLVKAAAALEKLIRTRYQITASQRKGLKEAIGNAVRDVLVPLGVNIGSAVITKKMMG